MKLNKNNIIWSKGPIRDTYSEKQTEVNSSNEEIINMITSIKENNIIFIRNGGSNNIKDLELFSNNIHLLQKPILLITLDGDRAIPSSHSSTTVNRILESNMIIRWYTQNYDKTILHPKIKYFQIGFDLHTTKWLVNNSISDKIKFMINQRVTSPVYRRISNKILSDTHNLISHPERTYLYNLIKNNNNIHFVSNRKSFGDITELYNKYNFVISARGNGIDTHRTWELFLAGVIVITKTSSLDEMFIKNNLPVVILQDWNELNHNLENKLFEWYNKHINKTSIENIFPRLTFQYWLYHSI